MLRAVILDLDGTLLTQGNTIAPGVADMMHGLRDQGLGLAIASNRNGAHGRIARAGLNPELILDQPTVGSPKGSPDWVDHVCVAFGVGRHELVWLGDGPNDMRSAVNARVAYFNAGWSAPHYPYGLQMESPAAFKQVILECFGETTDWFASLDAADQAGRQVTVRAMTDSWGGGSQRLENALVRFLKEREDFPLGTETFGFWVTMHLLGSIYGSGIAQVADTWTVYPGHLAASGPNASLSPFVHAAARLFRSRRNHYFPDLLIRHVDAPDSGQTRNAGNPVTIANQVNSVHLNPNRMTEIENKTVVVVDDFETDGNSQEWARNLLLQAGATGVISVNIGKYNMRGRGISRFVLTPSTDYAWDPYAPITYHPNDFRGGPQVVALNADAAAPQAFLNSMRRLAAP